MCKRVRADFQRPEGMWYRKWKGFLEKCSWKSVKSAQRVSRSASSSLAFRSAFQRTTDIIINGQSVFFQKCVPINRFKIVISRAINLILIIAKGNGTVGNVHRLNLEVNCHPSPKDPSTKCVTVRHGQNCQLEKEHFTAISQLHNTYMAFQTRRFHLSSQCPFTKPDSVHQAIKTSSLSHII